MPRSFVCSRKSNVANVLTFGALFLLSTCVPNTAGLGLADAAETRKVWQLQEPRPQDPPAQSSQAPVSNYDSAIFQNPIPSDQLIDLKKFVGTTSNNLIRDKQFRKLLKNVIPDCTFHYGRDMSLFDALEMVIKGSPFPVQIRDGRYLKLSGQSGPYLSGRGFLWIDLQDGVALGGFYFYPTNGEPTPSVNIFSRQVKTETLGLSQLPPPFAEQFNQWSRESRIPPVTTRYFITGSNRKILLEHDENYCSPDGATVPPEKWCEQMNADAADIDLSAAYYLEQTHHATNATAWMITGRDQSVWIRLRDDTCGPGPDQLRCRIRMTRERTRVIISRPPAPHPQYSLAHSD